MKQFLIALDQVLNTLFGGWADETLSSRLWRTRNPLYKVVDAIFFWEPNHCFLSYEYERLRLQLPPELRN